MWLTECLTELGLQVDWRVLAVGLDFPSDAPFVTYAEAQRFAAEVLAESLEDEEVAALACLRPDQRDETRHALETLADRSQLSGDRAHELLTVILLRQELSSHGDEPITSRISRLIGFFADSSRLAEEPDFVRRWRSDEGSNEYRWSEEGYRATLDGAACVD